MLDKSESFFGKKQKFKLEHKGKTVAVSVVDLALLAQPFEFSHLPRSERSW